MNDPMPTAASIYATCHCLGLQRAARATARRYDEALRPAGITSGQFAILSALLRDEAMPLGTLADLLGLERTTLTRNLVPLEAAGLVVSAAANRDRRVRAVALTKTGRGCIAEALPLWQAAQHDSEARLTSPWSVVRPALQQLT